MHVRIIWQEYCSSAWGMIAIYFGDFPAISTQVVLSGAVILRTKKAPVSTRCTPKAQVKTQGRSL